MQNMSIYGSSGFIGSNYIKKYNMSTVPVDRNERKPKSTDILYFISTTNNYHVFDNPYLDVDTNLKVLIETLEACRQYQLDHKEKVTFNFISSWFVYGDTKLPAHEKSICNPKGFYSITKKCAEDLLISYAKTFNMNYRIIRLCNVYGSGDKGASKKKNALQYMINNIRSSNEIKLYYDGNFLRDYLHVTDVCDAINLICKKGSLNEKYNVGSGERIKMKSIIDFCVEICNSDSKITPVDSPDFHKIVQVKDMVLNVDKLKNLGFKQKINIKDGLKILCQEK